MEKKSKPAKFLIGAAIGSGGTALAAERGGADFLLAINAGRLRNMGAPSIASMLPVFDSPQQTERFAHEELLTQCKAPVYLGVNVWEEDFDPKALAARVKEAGFSGAVNFPSCMSFSKSLRQILARAGRGVEQEVALLRAVQDSGLSSIFYCANRTQARLGADAELDLVCLNLGWNVGGSFGHQTRITIEEVAIVANETGRLIKRISPKTKFLLEGGPIGSPDDLARVTSLAPIDGYIGGSTIERTPVEESVADLIHNFRYASEISVQPDEKNTKLLAWARQYELLGQTDSFIKFLKRLKALAAATDSVLLIAEAGINSTATITALQGNARGARNRNVVQYDVRGEEFSARARTMLFGYRDVAGNRMPILADNTLDALVLHSPEQLTPAIQRRLARALRDRAFRATGSRKTLPVFPRVILVCESSVNKSSSREDLLSIGLEEELVNCFTGWNIRIPPLRERIDDLMLIIGDMASKRLDVPITRASFSSAALQKLLAYSWPGNEGELHSVLGGLAGRVGTTLIQPENLLFDSEIKNLSERRGAPQSEKDRIVDALWRHGYNRTLAAESLQMSRKTLYNKIQKFNLAG